MHSNDLGAVILPSVWTKGHGAGLLTIAHNRTRDKVDFCNFSPQEMLAHFCWAVRLLYFVGRLRLSSLGGLEEARSTTPLTRHNATTPNTTDIARKPPVGMNRGASATAEAPVRANRLQPRRVYPHMS